MKKVTGYKIVIIVLLVLILLFVFINFVYRTVQQNHWNDENKAIETALAQTDLVVASSVEPFSLEESFMIVYGVDEGDQAMIVWVGEEEVHSEYISDGVTREQIKEKVSNKDSEPEVLRITPGKYKEEWAWEVNYKTRLQDGDRTFYDYYRFSDGTLLETYSMSMKR